MVELFLRRRFPAFRGAEHDHARNARPVHEVLKRFRVAVADNPSVLEQAEDGVRRVGIFRLAVRKAEGACVTGVTDNRVFGFVHGVLIAFRSRHMELIETVRKSGNRFVRVINERVIRVAGQFPRLIVGDGKRQGLHLRKAVFNPCDNGTVIVFLFG